MVRFKATLTTCERVKPGQLFSTAGPEYWEDIDERSIGERVFIRTDAPCPERDAGEPIYIIDAVQEEAE